MTKNVDQIRAEIDRGITADKVAFPDPSAAPLGTDAEAAGAPPTTAELQMAGSVPSSPARWPRDVGTLVYTAAMLGISALIIGIVAVAILD